MIATKIVIYGSKDGGKYVAALKLCQDNPFLSEPFMITDTKRMKDFLTTPTLSLGIIAAPSVPHILNKCRGLNMGGVLFLADPSEVEQAGEDLVSEIVWDGSSADETLARLHAPQE